MIITKCFKSWKKMWFTLTICAFFSVIIFSCHKKHHNSEPKNFVFSKWYSDTTGQIFPLLAVSTDRGKTWSYKITSSTASGGELNMPSDTANPSFAFLMPGECSKNACMASGIYRNSNGDYPFLAASTDGGVTWSYKITSSAATGGELNMPSDASIARAGNLKRPLGVQGSILFPGGCTENTCLAGGYYETNSNQLYPLLAASTDGGVTWSYKITSSAATGGTLNMPSDVATTRNPSGTIAPAKCSNNICIASGSYENNNGQQYPLLAVSMDAGNTWSYKITSSVSTGGVLNMPSDAAMTNTPNANLNPGGCSGNICIASESYKNDNGQQYPLLAVSTDGGNAWNYKITSSASTGGTLNMPSDAASGSNSPNASLFPGGCSGKICTAAGSYQNDNGQQYPLLAVSTDGGNTWSYKITSSTGGGGLNMPSDAASGSNSPNTNLFPGGCAGKICTTAGSYQNDNGQQYPLLAVSTDGGNTWSYKITSSASTGGTLNMPSDAASGSNNPLASLLPAQCSNKICMAAGSYQNDNGQQYPLLAVSTDGGNTWSYKITSSASTGGALNMPSDSVSEPSATAILYPGGCSGKICTASGNYVNNNTQKYPLLALSADGGVTWSYKITSSTTTGGELNMPSDAATNGMNAGSVICPNLNVNNLLNVFCLESN